MNKTVVITGGGTGGHLKVADAFIDELIKRDINVIFIGSCNGQDKSWFENDERLSETFFLDTRGVVNKNKIGKVLSLSNIFLKMIKCLSIYSKYKIDTVISVGGFSAAAATFAAIAKPNCKLYIHEQNSKMGKLNELTAKFATEVFSSFIEESKIKDYPVSKEFFELSRIRKEIKTVAFFGGSQGAVAINNFALKVAPRLKEEGYRIIHQTGKNDFERVNAEYNKLKMNVDVFGFSKELPYKMKEADFAVSRAGASTLWEMCASGLPSLFIPYKYAAGDHQYYNAKDLVDKNIAFMSREDNLNEEMFFKALDCDVENISIRLQNSISSNATSLMVDYILDKS